MFVSQPALSLAVKELERELGTPLFARVGPGRASDPGRRPPCSGRPARRSQDLETGRAAVAAVAGVMAGSLSVCSLPTLAADPMAALVGRFRRHHPGVRIDLAAPEDTQELFDLVEGGTCELGLTDALHVPASFASIDLGSQSLVYIHPPGTELVDHGSDPGDRRAGRPVLRGGARGHVDAPTARRAARGRAEPTPTLAVVTASVRRSSRWSWRAPARPSSPRRWPDSPSSSERWSPDPNRRSSGGLALVHRHGVLSPAAERFLDLAST